MSFPVIPIEDARELLEQHKAGRGFNAAPAIRYIEQGPSFQQRAALALAEKLTKLKETGGRGKDFEAEACALVHGALGDYNVCMSSVGFWLWLTFGAAEGAFVEIVDWRFPKKRSDQFYGITSQASVFEGLFARLWWRGKCGYDESNERDPYSLAKRGDIDTWQSHIIRADYGRCRQVARALIREVWPDESPTKRMLTTGQTRELAKRLRIDAASRAYELLDQPTIGRLIADHAQAIKNDFR